MGASDTGKSYVVECLQFILGASEPPKKIEESKGYDRIEVIFEDADGSVFILERKLEKKADFILMEKKPDDSVKRTIIKSTQTKGPKSLSGFFLSKFDLGEKLLIKGVESLNTQALTMRTLEKIILVDEARIVSKSSPLGTGNYQDRTLETAFLKTLLTGEDDSEAKELKVEYQAKTSLKTKIKNLEELIDKLYPENTTDGTEENIQKDLEELELQLTEADQALGSTLSLNKSLIADRDTAVQNISEARWEQQEHKTLIERFRLLEEKYVSDRERLLAIGEAAQVIDQYVSVVCPTCGQDFDETVAEKDTQLISASADAEVSKINSELSGLSEAIVDLEKRIAEIEAIITENQKELLRLNGLIGGDIKARISFGNRLRGKMDKKRSDLMRYQMVVAQRTRAMAELGQLQKDHDSKRDKYVFPDFSKEIYKLTSSIKAVLKRWEYPGYQDLKFDLETRDIVLGEKPRKHFGKGYRAIGCSAYVIGLMTALCEYGRHPGFIVLDSPLTTYKKADKKIAKETPEEQITADLIYAFYSDLCESYSNRQIIVFDNQEPDKCLIEKMNYTHFSKNKSVGRYGFLPVL